MRRFITELSDRLGWMPRLFVNRGFAQWATLPDIDAVLIEDVRGAQTRQPDAEGPARWVREVVAPAVIAARARGARRAPHRLRRHRVRRHGGGRGAPAGAHRIGMDGCPSAASCVAVRGERARETDEPLLRPHGSGRKRTQPRSGAGAVPRTALGGRILRRRRRCDRLRVDLPLPHRRALGGRPSDLRGASRPAHRHHPHHMGLVVADDAPVRHAGQYRVGHADLPEHGRAPRLLACATVATRVSRDVGSVPPWTACSRRSRRMSQGTTTRSGRSTTRA